MKYTLIAPILLISSIANAQTSKLFPSTPHVFVTDSAGILSPPAIAQMNSIAKQTQATLGGDIAYVTLPSIGDYQPYEVGRDIYRTWKVGGQGPLGSPQHGLGVLLLVVPKTSAHRGQCYITTGRGAEGFITDSKAATICRETIIPYLKTGDYNQGMIAGGKALATLMAANAAPPKVSTLSAPAKKTGLGWLGLSAIVALVGFVGYGLYRLLKPIKPEREASFTPEIDPPYYASPAPYYGSSNKKTKKSRSNKTYTSGSSYIAPITTSSSDDDSSSSSYSSSSDNDDSSSSSSSDWGSSDSGSSFGGDGGSSGGGGGDSF